MPLAFTLLGLILLLLTAAALPTGETALTVLVAVPSAAFLLAGGIGYWVRNRRRDDTDNPAR
jgi:integral membrane sensor domain MASE1